MNEAMIAFLALLFLLLMAGIAHRWGWVTGKPAANARFFGIIIGAMYIVVLLGLLLSWKLACPVPDAWLSLECLRLSELWKGL